MLPHLPRQSISLLSYLKHSYNLKIILNIFNVYKQLAFERTSRVHTDINLILTVCASEQGIIVSGSWTVASKTWRHC